MNKKDWLLVLGLTLISPILTGYYFGVLDHDHYLPYLNRLLNPALYAGDYYFSQPHGAYAVFDYLVAFLIKLSGGDFPWTHLILYFITLGLFYGSVFYLTKTIYKKSEAAVLAVMFIMLPKWAAQIGYLTHHFYFVSRDLSLALALLALVFLLRCRRRLSLVLLFGALLVNPLIPLPVILLCFFDTNQFLGMVPVANQQWLQIIQERGTYSFPGLWHIRGWGTLIYYFSLLVIAGKILGRHIFGSYYFLIKRLIYICGSLFIFHWTISVLWPQPVLLQLQLLRSVNYIFILSLIAIAGALTELIERGRQPVKIMGILATSSLFFWSLQLTIWHMMAVWFVLPALWLFPGRLKPKTQLVRAVIGLILVSGLLVKLTIMRPQIKLPDYWFYSNPLINYDQLNSWRQVQEWAKANTPSEAVFLVPPEWSGFRSFSQRSIVADAKDGGMVFYSAAYAAEWEKRMADLKVYDNLSEENIFTLRQTYYFDYVVATVGSPPLPFNQVYQNQDFSVYRL